MQTAGLDERYSMKLGLITDSVGHLPFESALDLAKEQGLSSVEVGEPAVAQRDEMGGEP